MSPDAAVVGLAVILCVVGAAAAGDVAGAELSGGFGHLYLIVHFLYRPLLSICTVSLNISRHSERPVKAPRSPSEGGPPGRAAPTLLAS